jgi:ArsR family transcriptional regulator
VAALRNEYLRVFRAFSDINRLKVLEILRDGEQCACVLLDSLDISQPTLSHHMRILYDSGVVKARRVGKWSYYSIDAAGCERAKALLALLTEKGAGGGALLFRKLFRGALTLVSAAGAFAPPALAPAHGACPPEGGAAGGCGRGQGACMKKPVNAKALLSNSGTRA